MPPPEAVEIPPPPPTSVEERANFFIERLPDQGSPEANAALRARLNELLGHTVPIERDYEAGLRRILGHRLDDPGQNILEEHNLARAMQNATPEELAAVREHTQQIIGPLTELSTELLTSLNPESVRPFMDAGRELMARHQAHTPPSYHDIFPLPSYHEITPPTYGEHITDEIVTSEREAQLPESAFTRRTPESDGHWESLLDEIDRIPAEVTEPEATAHPLAADRAERAAEQPPARSRWRLPSFNWHRAAHPAPVVEAPHLEIPGGWRSDFDEPERPNTDLLRHDMPGSWRPEFDAPPPAIEHPPAEVARYDMPGSWRSEFDLPPEEAVRHDMPGSWRPEFDAPAVAGNRFVSAIKEGIADLVNRLHL